MATNSIIVSILSHYSGGMREGLSIWGSWRWDATNLPTFILHTYLHTYLPTYLLSYPSIHLPTYSPIYTLMCIPSSSRWGCEGRGFQLGGRGGVLLRKAIRNYISCYNALHCCYTPLVHTRRNLTSTDTAVWNSALLGWVTALSFNSTSFIPGVHSILHVRCWLSAWAVDVNIFKPHEESLSYARASPSHIENDL